MKQARMKVTVIGVGNTYVHKATMSTDLPAEALGQALAEAIQKAWKEGEDPTKCIIGVQFS